MKNSVLNRKIWVSGVPHKVGTGWLSPQPDLRDYTPASKQVTSFNRKLKFPSLTARLQDRKTAGHTDLREWCSPVENQLDLGACTAHAGIGIVEYFERRAFGKHIDASRLFLYKVTRNLLQWTGDTGAYLRTTMKALVCFGVPPEEFWPYNIERYDEEPAAFLYAFGLSYKTVQYYRLDPLDVPHDQVLQRIKAGLAAG